MSESYYIDENVTLTEALQRNQIQPKTMVVGTQKIKCPQCQGFNGGHKYSDNPLSLTIKDDANAVWHCHHCGWSSHVSKQGKRLTKYRAPEFKKPKMNQDSDNRDMLKYMKERGISNAIVEKYKLYQQGEWFCFPYFNELGELTNVKSRTKDKRFRQESDAKSIIYNYDNIHNKDTVIWVEGEMDVLSFAEIGIDYATTLPNGAPKEFKGKPDDKRFSALSHCPLNLKKIIIFTDNDESGRALHQEILHRFGKDIAWKVKIPQGIKDANELLVKQGPQALQEAIDNAVPYPVDGLYTTRDYYHQIHELYDGNYDKPLEIGVPSIDGLYKIMPSTFHVWTGIPNHGKSMFLDYVLLKLARKHGQKFAVFSPEHSTQMHIRRMVQMISGKAFDEGFNQRMDKKELNEALAFLYKHFYFIETRDSVPKIDLILEIAKSSVMKFGVNGLVIDPYNEVDASRNNGKREDEHIRDFISLCKRFGRVHDCTIFVVAHPTKLQKSNQGRYDPPSAYEISGAAHWHNQADAIVTIHRDFDQNTTTFMTRKIREQGLYGQIGQAEFVYDFNDRTYKERVMSDDDWSYYSDRRYAD
tara:strand:- start:20757 stop:22511 length:1755 start_codon:yes stop_codon:yes gene_type:complete